MGGNLPPRGHSLLETVIALFIFITAVLFVAASADSALRAGGRSAMENRAAFVAQSRLAEVRSWLQNTPPNRFAGYAGYPNLGTWVPDQLGLESRVELAPHSAYTPDRSSESFLPLDQRRALDASLLRVCVQVRWGTRSFRLVSLVSDSRRGWRAVNPIEISAVTGSGALAQGSPREFTAVGYDELGSPIPDLTFSWSFVAGTSSGILEWQRPDGKQARFVNHILKVPGPGFDFAGPGEVWVVATARYWGVEQTGRLVLELQ